MCENNSVPPEGREQGQYPSSSLAATQLIDVPSAMNIESHIVDGSDLRAVAPLLTDLVARTRNGEGPFFVESRLTRWPGNMATFPELIGGPYQIGWAWDPSTADAKLQSWLSDSDPIALFARALVDEGVMSREDVEADDAKAQAEAAGAKAFALGGPVPEPASAMDYIFA